MRSLGFRVFRVRHHDRLARLEVGADELARALEPAMTARLSRALQEAGYDAGQRRSRRAIARAA